MTAFGRLLKRFFANKAGISSVEYALLLAFIAAGIITAAGSLSTAVECQMKSAAHQIDASVAECQ